MSDRPPASPVQKRFSDAATRFNLKLTALVNHYNGPLNHGEIVNDIANEVRLMLSCQSELLTGTFQRAMANLNVPMMPIVINDKVQGKTHVPSCNCSISLGLTDPRCRTAPGL